MICFGRTIWSDNLVERFSQTIMEQEVNRFAILKEDIEQELIDQLNDEYTEQIDILQAKIEDMKHNFRSFLEWLNKNE